MTIQWGKNPEYTFSTCINYVWHGGEIALPFKITWWHYIDAVGHRNVEISLTFLCFRFGLEIWRWKK